MAIPWLVALKVIPWGDVIEHAPKVLSAARKMLDRQRANRMPPTVLSERANSAPSSEPPSLSELENRLQAVQQLMNQQAMAQDQLTQTLAELAEQNARLVSAVELLRVRTRVLMGGMVLLSLGLGWVLWG
jgi:hypothetical protein